MSIELRDVKRRIRTTRQIHKVTDALQKVASTRLAGDRRAIEHAERYATLLREVLTDLIVAAPDWSHPLTHARGGPRTDLIVFGSERGLCGGFNSGLVEKASAFFRERPPDSVRVLAVGKVVARRMRRMRIAELRTYPQPERGARAGVVYPGRRELIDELVYLIENDFLSGKCGAAYVLYARFVTSLTQVPVIERILPAPGPFGRSQAGIGGVDQEFEPRPEEMLSRLLPEYLAHLVDRAFLNSAASENAARQNAMSRASDNAKTILSDLLASYRRLRQESITTEMIELAGGGAGFAR